MGVKLTSILEKKPITFEELSGKSIAVDFSNSAYQFLSSIRQPDGTLLMDSKGNVTSHLMGIWTRFSNLISKNIKLVIVLDGEMPLLKKGTSEDRKEKKKEAKEKFEEAYEEGDEKLMGLYAKQTSFLDKDMINESKELMEAMGLPVIQAPSEADSQMAFLSKNNDVWACGTSDVDPLLHGAKRTVTNLTLSQRRKLSSGGTIKINPEVIDLNDTLKRLGINQKQFIILAILVGTDYNKEGIKGIGPKKALKLIKEKNDYDNMFKELNADFDWKEIYELFENMDVLKKYKIKWESINAKKIKNLLVDKHEFNEERVDNVISRLMESNKKQEQTGLGKWM
ncbi:flap endonuclease-1 [Candidatus Woesearchaeota archaeon]|nr:flap endonuclease-1 [Candidatus Woesearchaeota archaeon]